jgi:hypothetical protein
LLREALAMGAAQRHVAADEHELETARASAARTVTRVDGDEPVVPRHELMMQIRPCVTAAARM